MKKDPLFESAWARTFRDFLNAFHTYGWCSFALGVTAIIWEGYMIVVPLYIIPTGSTSLATGWIQAGTFVVGMVLFLFIVFSVVGLFTPYRQRNEARKMLQVEPTLDLSVQGSIVYARPLRANAGDNPLYDGGMIWAAGNVLIVNKGTSRVILKPQGRLVSKAFVKPVILDMPLQCLLAWRKPKDPQTIAELEPEIPHCENPLVLEPQGQKRVHLEFLMEAFVLEIIGWAKVAQAQNFLQFTDILSGMLWVEPEALETNLLLKLDKEGSQI